MTKSRVSRSQSTESRQAATAAKAARRSSGGRAEAPAQRTPAEAIGRSPRVLQQQAFAEGIRNSPQMVAQRERIQISSGGLAPIIQRAAVKDTKVDGKAVTVSVGSDFTNNHMAKDDDAAKTLSRGRVARSSVNTVVLDGADAVKAALEGAEVPGGVFNKAPNNFLTVSGLTAKKVQSLPKSATTPEAVTSQNVSNQNPVKIKYAPHRLADNIVEASGVKG